MQDVLDQISDILDPTVTVAPQTIALFFVGLFATVVAAVYVGKKIK